MPDAAFVTECSCCCIAHRLKSVMWMAVAVAGADVQNLHLLLWQHAGCVARGNLLQQGVPDLSCVAAGFAVVSEADILTCSVKCDSAFVGVVSAALTKRQLPLLP